MCGGLLNIIQDVADLALKMIAIFVVVFALLNISLLTKSSTNAGPMLLKIESILSHGVSLLLQVENWLVELVIII